MYIRPLLLLLGSHSEMPLLLLNIPSPLDISWVYKASSELILAGRTGLLQATHLELLHSIMKLR